MIATENNFAFIDNQNLFAELKRCGWDLDYQRFIIYLREKYSATRIFLFIGYVEKNLKLYEKLYSFGYELIFKPTLNTPTGIKGNCDSDMVLHTIRLIEKFDQAIVVSGDGDFHSLIEYLIFKDKLKIMLIPNRLRYSSLLKRFRRQSEYLNDFQQRLSLKKKSPDKDETL